MFSDSSASFEDIFGSGLAAILLLLLGVGVIGFAAFQAWSYLESVNWPTAQGEVVWAEVIEQSEYSNDRRRTNYRPDIRYTYTAGGQSYTHDAINFGQNICPEPGLCLTLDVSSSDRAEAQRYVDTYPRGASVTVTYNPDNPQEAVLERKLHPAIYILVGMGVVLLVIGLFMMPRGS